MASRLSRFTDRIVEYVGDIKGYYEMDDIEAMIQEVDRLSRYAEDVQSSISDLDEAIEDLEEEEDADTGAIVPE